MTKLSLSITEREVFMMMIDRSRFYSINTALMKKIMKSLEILSLRSLLLSKDLIELVPVQEELIMKKLILLHKHKAR